MRNCGICHVHLPDNPARCPLCHRETQGGPSDRYDPVFPPLPTQTVERLVFLWMAFLSVSAAFICLIINYVFPTGVFWFWYVLAGLASFWISLGVLMKKRRNIPKSIIWQATVFSLLALAWDYCTGFSGWSIDYVIPILYSLTMIILSLLPRIMKMHIQDYILYFLVSCVLGLSALVLMLTGWVDTILPAAICLVISVVSLFSLLFFEGKVMLAEIQRRFHF